MPIGSTYRFAGAQHCYRVEFYGAFLHSGKVEVAFAKIYAVGEGLVTKMVNVYSQFHILWKPRNAEPSLIVAFGKSYNRVVVRHDYRSVGYRDVLVVAY